MSEGQGRGEGKQPSLNALVSAIPGIIPPSSSVSPVPGVHELEKSGIRAAFMNAVVAATNRADELSKL